MGSRLTTALREQGAHARRASRHGGDVHFDWSDSSTWSNAVAGTDSLFIIGPGSGSDWSPRLPELLEVAEEAGASRAVLLSARAVEFHPEGVVAAAERTLRAGRVPWTILRPSHFSQNFTEAMFAPVEGVVTAPVGDGAEPFIDVLDIAEVAAAVLRHGGHDGETIDLSGPEALTFAAAVAQLSEGGSSPLTFANQDRDDHIAALRNAGTPELYIAWRMAMLDAIRTGADARVSDGVAQVLGRPATTFRAWVQREAA
ncbi:MAG: NAD(P)H-binding protein, partial [Pseudolysinimonas sp.]